MNFSEFDALLDNMIKLNQLLSNQDETLNSTNTNLLKYLNRTNSNTSCNSTTSSNTDSGYSTQSNNNNTTSSPTIIYGFYGKAKQASSSIQADEQQNSLVNSRFVESDELRSQIEQVCHGDDVGLVVSKTVSSKQENSFYFAIADGVSANRLRGYDAKLFPNALLHSCAEFISKNSSNQIEHSTTECFCVHLNQNLDQQDLDQCQSDADLDEEEELNTYEEEAEQEEEEVYESGIEDLLSNEEECLNCSGGRSDCKYLCDALAYAHSRVQEQSVYGSSTACLLSLRFYPKRANLADDDLDFYSPWLGVLSTCNLGDSGYLIIRNKQVIYKSQTQTHRFNAPYQLGCTPPELLDHDLYRDKCVFIFLFK